MAYSIVVAPAAARDLRRIPPEFRDTVKARIAALSGDPRLNAQKLTGQGAHRIRVGDYRVVFLIDDRNRRILVVRVRHRRDVYRG